jgi:hypothetical protein
MMLPLPAVIIGYSADLRPSSVICSRYGEQLLRSRPSSMSADRAFTWIAGLFEEHAVHKHGMRRSGTQS